jgi:hypothetical protein
MMRIKPILINCLIVLMFTPMSWAEEKGGGDLRAAVQNPVGAMYSLPFKFNFDYGAPNGEASFLNIQPVIPITVGDWNYINRIIAPLIDTPGQVTGTPEIPNPPPGDGATGLGDINYSLFVSPTFPGKLSNKGILRPPLRRSPIPTRLPGRHLVPAGHRPVGNEEGLGSRVRRGLQCLSHLEGPP